MTATDTTAFCCRCKVRHRTDGCCRCGVVHGPSVVTLTPLDTALALPKTTPAEYRAREDAIKRALRR